MSQEIIEGFFSHGLNTERVMRLSNRSVRAKIASRRNEKFVPAGFYCPKIVSKSYCTKISGCYIPRSVSLERKATFGFLR
jgi:hypothetical protein